MSKTIYTFFAERYNKIFFRGYKDGKRIQSSDVNYKPVLYVPSEEESEFKSIYGENLKAIEFDSIKSAKDYCKQFKEVSRIHGNNSFAYDFIHQQFPGELEVSISDLKILSYDIETSVELSFPDVKNPVEEILLITTKDLNSKALVTFGCKHSDVENYIRCADEKDLLSKFINHIVDTDPDILTGWNVINFDTAYISARIKKVLGQSALNRLSPFNIVEEKTKTIMGQEVVYFDIFGRCVLDLLELYKKFRFINRPSYKLDYIANVELSEKKLENPHKSFKQHYKADWTGNKSFTLYNQIDVHLVDKLEDKLGLVYLAVTLAYLTKINFSDVFSPVRTWENYILSTLLQRNIFCQLKVTHQSEDSIVGGFVKEITPGRYPWTGTLDAASLYPSIIMSLNMSPETIVDMLPSVNPESLLEGHLVNSGDNFAVAANGARFRKDILGVMTGLTADMFVKRKTAKNEMIRLKKLYESTHEEHYKKDSAKYGVLQLALKVTLNELFGAQANQYFLFFDNRIAEGITMTGQFIIQEVSKAANECMKKVCKVKKDYIVYNDTDSLAVSFDELVKLSPKKLTEDETVNYILKFIKGYLGKEIDNRCEEISKRLNFYENKISFKTEAISSSTITLAKKRYAQRVLDNEGVRYTEPEYKVTGIETNRSSTPDLIREWLMDAIKLILDGCTQEVLIQYVEKRRSEFLSYPVEAISFPRSANNLKQYSDRDTIYTKGCPIAVRAALLYNHLLKKHGLTKDLEEIKEGNKILYCALTEPNPLRENIIGYPSVLPGEFGLHKYINYTVQFEKSFLDPLTKITDALKWKLVEQSDLDCFF